MIIQRPFNIFLSSNKLLLKSLLSTTPTKVPTSKKWKPEKPAGKLDESDDEEEWVEMFNKETGEWNGPRHGEPTRFGDWQHLGRTSDF